MIKINLLPPEKKRFGSRLRRSNAAAPSQTALLAVFGLALLLEVGGMLYWQTVIEETLAGMGGEEIQLNEERDRLGKQSSKLKKLKKLSKEVESQRVVFKVLENGKVGPLHMLMFMSYVLQKVDPNLPEDEYRALNSAWAKDDTAAGGSDTEWNPASVWLTAYKEKDGRVTIQGAAINHEDVMQFLRRLKTSIYFEGLDLVKQKQAMNGDFDFPYVTFEFEGLLNYDPTGYASLE